MITAPHTRATLVLGSLFVVFVQAAGGSYAAHGVESPAALDLFHSAGLLWLGGIWLRADARLKQFRWPYCLGVFPWVASVVVVPYYLWRTRGAKGVLMMLGLVAAYLPTDLIGVAVYLLLV